MIARHTFWQVFTGDYLKPKLHGDLVYLLEVPDLAGLPVLRNVFDPSGQAYPANSYERLQALVELGHHGILFEGVSRAGVDALMDWEPPITAEDSQFLNYNRRLIWSSMNLLLADPYEALEHLPEPVLKMLGLDGVLNVPAR